MHTDIDNALQGLGRHIEATDCASSRISIKSEEVRYRRISAAESLENVLPKKASNNRTDWIELVACTVY